MKVFKDKGESIFSLLNIKFFMLLYKESISIWTSSNSCISGCCELSFTCVCFFLGTIWILKFQHWCFKFVSL
jgi:hypothetical protein